MSGEPVDYGALPEQTEIYAYAGADGPVRIMDYGVLIDYEVHDGYSDAWNHYDTGYIDPKFVTSEGIHAGSTRAEVLAAYEKYGVTDVAAGYSRNIGGLPAPDLETILENGIETYSYGEMGAYRWMYLVKALAESEDGINTHDLLYADDGTDAGITQFGGLGAWIFVFDDLDAVRMIIWTAPTSG